MCVCVCVCVRVCVRVRVPVCVCVCVCVQQSRRKNCKQLLITCHTDGEIVSKLLPDVLHQVSAIREPILHWLPLIPIWGVCSKQALA